MNEHICNWCGLSCGLEPHPIDPSQTIEGGLLNAKVSGNYFSTPGNGSGALDDLDQYSFNLCEWCLDYMFRQFRIPPRVNEIDIEGKIIGDEAEFIPAAERVEKQDWRGQKQQFFDEYIKRSQARQK